MITYLQAVGVIENFANQNEMVQKFGFEFREQMPNIATEDERYPLLFVVPIGATPTTNTNEFEIDIYCLDRYTQDRVNVGSVVSDTQLILAMLTKWLEEGQTDLDVIHSYPMQPINNDLLDYCGGWVLRVRVEVDMVSICEIPLSGVEPPPTPTCEDAIQVIEDSLGNQLYSNSIPSGATETQVIQDSDYRLLNTNGIKLDDGVILAEGGLDITAPDAVVNFQYEDGSPLATVNYLSGSTQDAPLSNNYAENSDLSYQVSVPYGTTIPLPDITVTDSDGSTYTQPSVTDVVCTLANLDLYWELNYNGTDDIIFIPATINNVGTLTSGSGSNVGAITVSTDGVTYGSLSFPFTPVATTTYYFKRSTATVTGSYTMVGTYV